MGYDLNRFEGDVDDEFKCPICCSVLEDAVQSPDCEHTFCSSCIHEWLGRQPNCPVDRRPLRSFDLKPAPRVLRNFLAKLDIQCDFAASGCASVVKLELLQSHTIECDFNPHKQIPCAKGCGLVLQRKHVESHNCLADLRELVSGQQKQLSELRTNRRVLSDEISELKSTVRRIQEEQLTEQGHKLSQLQVQLVTMQTTMDQLAARQEQQQQHFLKQQDPSDSAMVALDCSNYRSSCHYSNSSPGTSGSMSGVRKRTFPTPSFYQVAAKRPNAAAASTPPHRHSQAAAAAGIVGSSGLSNNAAANEDDSDRDGEDGDDTSPLSIPPMSPCSPLSLTTAAAAAASAAHHHHYYHCSQAASPSCSSNRIIITFYGTVLTITGVSTSDTISSVKEKIEDKEAIPAEEQQLFFAGQQLDDERTLAFYSIPSRHPHLATHGHSHGHGHSDQSGSGSGSSGSSGISRHLILRLRDGMKIFVKTLSDKVIEVQADPNDLIEIIKVKIHEQEGISPCDQRLLLDGHDLADLRTLSDYGIQHKSTLQLDLHLGGPCPICQSQFRSTGTSTGGEMVVPGPGGGSALAHKGKGKGGKGKGERTSSGKAVGAAAATSHVATSTSTSSAASSPISGRATPSPPSYSYSSSSYSRSSHSYVAHSSGKRDRDNENRDEENSSD